MKNQESAPKKEIILYCDGACSFNPGPGGWAAILQYRSHQKKIAGYTPETTNNRMELMAAIKGLEALKEPCIVEIFSDSAYVCNAFLKGWLPTWKKNGWKLASKKKEVENKDLWILLDQLICQHQVHWNKVKGHADNALNNECDRLAREQIQLHHS